MWTVYFRYLFDGRTSETFCETFATAREAKRFTASMVRHGAEEVVCLFEDVTACV